METYLHLAYHVIHLQTQSSWCPVFDEDHAHSLYQTEPTESPAPAPTSKWINYHMAWLKVIQHCLWTDNLNQFLANEQL